MIRSKHFKVAGLILLPFVLLTAGALRFLPHVPCPAEGIAVTPDRRELLSLKNRVGVPKPQEFDERVTLEAYRVLGCRDWSRIDVRLDADGQPNVVEVNPLPGILPDPADNSCFPKAARAAGMSYDELIQSCLLHAAARQGVELGREVRRERAA